MTIDMSKLEDGLSKLRGLDFEQVEARVRSRNAAAVEVSVLKEFQARLAAKALSVPYEDIAELPLREYTQVCTATLNFLFAPSGDEMPSENSEA